MLRSLEQTEVSPVNGTEKTAFTSCILLLANMMSMHKAYQTSWNFGLNYGATSLPEDWDYQPGNSQNHFMLGHITEWFYHDLAGINANLPVPQLQQDELARRKARYLRNPDSGETWDQVKQSILQLSYRYHPPRYA